MKKVKITVLKTTLDKELAMEYGADNLTAFQCKKRSGFLCGLCKTRWIMRRGLESYISVCFCTGAWRGGGYILLRRLDKNTGSSNLQL